MHGPRVARQNRMPKKWGMSPAYRNALKALLLPAEERVFRRLDTPQKIQTKQQNRAAMQKQAAQISAMGQAGRPACQIQQPGIVSARAARRNSPHMHGNSGMEGWLM